MKVVGQTGQTGEHKQANGRTNGRYQVHYLPRFAVNNNQVLAIMNQQIMIYVTFITIVTENRT